MYHGRYEGARSWPQKRRTPGTIYKSPGIFAYGIGATNGGTRSCYHQYTRFHWLVQDTLRKSPRCPPAKTEGIEHDYHSVGV